jgi:hypothetical protein
MKTSVLTDSDGTGRIDPHPNVRAGSPNNRSYWSLDNCRKTFPGKVRGTADPSATLRFGRDDKGEGKASMESGCWTEGSSPWVGHRPMTPPVAMTKLLGYVRLYIDWKNHNLPKTNLSSRPERTRISCHASLDVAARAAFVKESRMKFANATKFNRKFGVA